MAQINKTETAALFSLPKVFGSAVYTCLLSRHGNLSYPFLYSQLWAGQANNTFLLSRKVFVADPFVKDQPPLQSQSQGWLTANEEGFSISEQFCQVAWLLWHQRSSCGQVDSVALQIFCSKVVKKFSAFCQGPIVQVMVGIKEPFGKVLYNAVLGWSEESSKAIDVLDELVQGVDALQHGAVNRVFLRVQNFFDHFLQAR